MTREQVRQSPEQAIFDQLNVWVETLDEAKRTRKLGRLSWWLWSRHQFSMPSFEEINLICDLIDHMDFNTNWCIDINERLDALIISRLAYKSRERLENSRRKLTELLHTLDGY